MLILPQGHWQTTVAPRRLARREKWMIGTVLGLLAVGIVALAVSFSAAGRSSGNGCVDVTVQYVTGGTELYRCGSQARALCSSAGVPGGPNRSFNQALARACRQAGLPVSR